MGEILKDKANEIVVMHHSNFIVYPILFIMIRIWLSLFYDFLNSTKRGAFNLIKCCEHLSHMVILHILDFLLN